jgi:hypothetical protein
MPATPNLRTRAARLVAGLRGRHRWLDVALRGYARYQRTEGPVAAVHVAYSAFFSIFPLLFAAVGIFCSASGCCSGCRWRPPPSSAGPAARSWRPPG